MVETYTEITPPVSCRVCRLGQFAIYGTTINANPDAVNTRRCAVKSYPAGRSLLREGEVQTQLFTLYSGWAFRFLNLPKGRQILHFHIPGDFIALESLAFSGMALPFGIRSLTPVTLCLFPIEEAASLLSGSEPQRVQTVVTAQRFFSDANRRMADLGRRSALGRMAHLLLGVESALRRRQLSKNGHFEFPVRQEHLADALGLTTVYVNRTLDRLRKTGLIDFDRQRMTIRDLAALRAIAEEE